MNNTPNSRMRAICGLSLLVLLLLPVGTAGLALTQPDIENPLSVKATVAEYNLGTDLFDIEWNPNGEVLAATSFDGVFIFDSHLQPLIHLYADQAIRGVAWSPEGAQLALTRGSNLEIGAGIATYRHWNSSTLYPVVTCKLVFYGVQMVN